MIPYTLLIPSNDTFEIVSWFIEMSNQPVFDTAVTFSPRQSYKKEL